MSDAPLLATIRSALAEEAEAAVGTRPAVVPLAAPASPEMGDVASPVAMALAKAARRSPREIAEAIAADLPGRPGVADWLARVEVAGPGFLNMTLTPGALAAARRRRRRRRGAATARAPRRCPRTCCWSSSRSTPPGRPTWATPAAAPTATRSVGSWPSPGTPSRGSTTSTTTGARCAPSARRWPCATRSCAGGTARSRRTGTTATTSPRSPPRCGRRSATSSPTPPRPSTPRWSSASPRGARS